jgi:hypothetical protein
MNKALPFFVALSFSSIPADAGDFIFYYQSSPGDYIGQGEEVVLTPEYPANFSISRNYHEGITVSVRTPSEIPYPQSHWWYLEFTAPYRVPLSVGNYEDAARHPFQEIDQPGLSMYGNGRGCNRLSGQFDVREVTYEADEETVSQFAADFVQICELFMPPLFGAIRYNSDVPLPAFVPGSITLINEVNADKCVEATSENGAVIEVQGETPQENDVIMDWSTSGGASGAGQTFSFVVGVGESQDVTLTLSDGQGSEKRTTRSVCVSDTVAPGIEILSPRQSDSFKGNNMRLEVQINDTVDKSIDSYEVFIGRKMTVQLQDGRSNIKLSKDSAAQSDDTEIVVRAVDASGNAASESVVVSQD